MRRSNQIISRTVIANLGPGLYSKVEEWTEDMKLIWANALSFNTPGSVREATALEMKAKFETLRAEFDLLLETDGWRSQTADRCYFGKRDSNATKNSDVSVFGQQGGSIGKDSLCIVSDGICNAVRGCKHVVMVKKCNIGDGYDRRETVRLFTRQSNSRPPMADHCGSEAVIITDISRIKMRTEWYLRKPVAVGVTFQAR